MLKSEAVDLDQGIDDDGTKSDADSDELQVK